MNFRKNLSRILNSSAPALVAISLLAIHRSSYLFENKTELELYEETNKILEFIATDYLGSKSDNLGMAVLYGGREVEASRNHYIDYLSKKRAEISGLISEVRYSHHIESSVAKLLIKSLECGEKVIYLNILHLRYYPGASGIASAMTSVIPCIYNSALRVLEVAIALDPSVSFGIQRDINHIFNFIVSDIIPGRSIPLLPYHSKNG